MAKGVTPKSTDYNKWYTDVISKSQMADYGPVKGTMVIRPYGYGIWENVRDAFDSRFKATGHTNAYFPLFIPKSFLSKEAEHVEGFAKECAVVTHTRLKATEDGKAVVVDPASKLEEEIIVRPTSETIIWSMYKKWINSYRDLPLLINQWANVVRWEMRTRLFIRTSEFLWQEGHTAHSTKKEAIEETLKMLEVYREVAEDVLAIPVLTGLKSESEKFAGAVDTYCIEAMMGDKKALQAGTSHYLGQNFAKAFDVKYQDENNKEEYVYATSWGVSTRLIGAIIMAHGDDKGLRLPPAIAPIQVVVIPITRSDEDGEMVKSYLDPLIKSLKQNGIRVHIDDRKKMSPGFKFNEWEMKGVPIRLEVGPRDMKQHSVFLARRDTSEKFGVEIAGASSKIIDLLDEIQNNLFDQALAFREDNTFSVSSYDEFKSIVEKGGFIRCGWDGDAKTEEAVKAETKATIRVIPFDEKPEGLACIYSGKPAKHEVIFSKAY
ncbi:MAG: proline--tRNA ligase [Candidatus Marinimicrobia bacterium]|jgi:prolyl-tRNA synthetase|nr:proline--tRNA ligase [Candidatus Neomarinimicrobiota bacterium]MBT3633847.1 proline--tRNA ligase [Candidatus Neomarinimicrobiota bacterium]MBT3682639.1 proline--tRNA ligase [Candidatus Neomarinimicrobiota bacterium]MBT3759403.1 proline--tRNA ligase [Candidatus Neomarinimicrobiota bacterium]MBT3894589.1 proline--tRNA ligase [Candidatus Neomarinimicrobiota bacterium]